MHRLWGQSPAECPEGVGEARPHVQCAGLGQSGKRPWGAPSRPAGDQGSDRRGEKHEPALTSRLRHHDLVRGWRGPVHRTRGARADGNAAALPRGVPANVATVTPSCPHVNRIACGELPCSDEGRVVERILKYLEEKNSKSWASFHFYCHFPWATGQVLPTPRGLRTLSHPHTPRAALAFPPRPGERARRRRLPAGDVRWWC